MNSEPIKLVETKDLAVCIDNHTILDNVNIEVKEGEFVYLIGKVGSGKTSLLKTLYSELSIKRGNAIVAGHDISSLKRKHIPTLRRKIGMIFQDFELMSDRNIYNNLAFVLKATDWKSKLINERIDQVLNAVGMINKKNSMPSELSGGEKQSIAIARALLNDPQIFFADEPTGNLDPASANSVMEILYKLKDSGKSVIMITHNYNLLKKFPGKIYACENSSVTEYSISDIESN